jgi:peptidoglycan hydrolase-like protein with peptidoglycan-binding domain
MNRRCAVVGLVFVVLCGLLFTGCDLVYRVIQREGAEEKDLLGEVIPSVPNAIVEEVQKLLAIHGFPSGVIDGKFGFRVREAVVNFQREKGLKPSRFVDHSTWKALNVFYESGLVKDGQVNIKGIQEYLSREGFEPGPVDGRKGPKTQEAIRSFQQQFHLKVDGQIGPQTLNAMHQQIMQNRSSP